MPGEDLIQAYTQIYSNLNTGCIAFERNLWKSIVTRVKNTKKIAPETGANLLG